MSEQTNLDAALYPLDLIAHAAGRSIHLFRKWQTSGLRLTKPERGDNVSRGRGRVGRYTLRTAIRLALMAEMTAWGVPVGSAYLTARKFTDVGDGEFDAGGRGPGECFPHGKTWLVFHNQDIGNLVNVRNDAPLEWPDDSGKAIFIIDCESVVEKVRARLTAKIKA